MNIFVIHHSADFDGLFCREIAVRGLAEDIRRGVMLYGDVKTYIIGWDYGDPVPVILDNVDQIIMLDVSIAELMSDPRLVWIDHHKSAMDKFSPDILGYRVDGVAACRLAWQWFNGALAFGGRNHHAREMPPRQAYLDRTVDEPYAVQLAGEYDVWDKRNPEAELFQDGLRSQELTPNVWDMLLDGMTSCNSVQDLLRTGKILTRARAKEYAEVITQQGFDVDFAGLKFLACNSHELDIRSSLFTAGVKPHHDGLLGFTWNGRAWRVSLYGVPGKPDIDFSQIAVKYGDGGHKQACGFMSYYLPFIAVHPDGLKTQLKDETSKIKAHKFLQDFLTWERRYPDHPYGDWSGLTNAIRQVIE